MHHLETLAGAGGTQGTQGTQGGLLLGTRKFRAGYQIGGVSPGGVAAGMRASALRALCQRRRAALKATDVPDERLLIARLVASRLTPSA